MLCITELVLKTLYSWKRAAQPWWLGLRNCGRKGNVPFVRELPEVCPACFSTQHWLLVLPGSVQFLALLGSEER